MGALVPGTGGGFAASAGGFVYKGGSGGGATDPLVPGDGTQNVTGNLNVSGTTVSGGALTVTTGGATITAGGLTVSASGAAITGNSTVTGTLGVSDTTTISTTALATTVTPKLTLHNTTAATVGTTVQVAPAVKWISSGWDIDNATPREVYFTADVLPTTANSVTGSWRLQASIAGAAANTCLLVDSFGQVFPQDALIMAAGKTLGFGGTTNTHFALSGANFNMVAQSATQINIKGNLAAANAGQDVVIQSQVSRNATDVICRIANNSTALVDFRGDGKINMASAVTQSTVGSAGGASALPATPTGYLRFFVAGTERVIPYYDQA